MAWNVPAALHAEIGGDPGPWHRHVKTAWRASITKTSDLPLPKSPPAEYINAGSGDDHGKIISYWAPILQLLVFGLGWARPDIGLLRWREKGYPQGDPILRTVMRWWGEDGVVDFLAWAQARDGFSNLEAWLANVANLSSRGGGFPGWADQEDLVMHAQTEEWKAIWGGGTDPHHLIPHAQFAAEEGPFPLNAERFVHDKAFKHSGLLMVDVYAGWYLALIHEFKDGPEEVEVIVKPIGWLGTFHRSPQTGLWHRTDEATHLMASWA